LGARKLQTSGTGFNTRQPHGGQPSGKPRGVGPLLLGALHGQGPLDCAPRAPGQACLPGMSRAASPPPEEAAPVRAVQHRCWLSLVPLRTAGFLST
jgi:hypothetical protein